MIFSSSLNYSAHLLWGSVEIIYLKHLVQCLTSGKSSLNTAFCYFIIIIIIIIMPSQRPKTSGTGSMGSIQRVLNKT